MSRASSHPGRKVKVQTKFVEQHVKVEVRLFEDRRARSANVKVRTAQGKVRVRFLRSATTGFDPGRVENDERAFKEGNRVLAAPRIRTRFAIAREDVGGWTRRSFYLFLMPRPVDTAKIQNRPCVDVRP